jgi:hypothetical protein
MGVWLEVVQALEVACLDDVRPGGGVIDLPDKSTTRDPRGGITRRGLL